MLTAGQFRGGLRCNETSIGGTHIYSGNIGGGGWGAQGLIHSYRWGGIPLYVSNRTSHLAYKNQLDNNPHWP